MRDKEIDKTKQTNSRTLGGEDFYHFFRCTFFFSSLLPIKLNGKKFNQKVIVTQCSETKLKKEEKKKEKRWKGG